MKKESKKKKESKDKSENGGKPKSIMKKNLSIELDIDLINQLDKRARKNFMSLREVIVDILRRSMISYSKDSRGGYAEPEVEKFVGIFSRKKRGRKPKR